MKDAIRQRKTILIVDDEQEIRDVVRETLMVDNFEIREAASGDEALEQVREKTPDLILLDVKMPGKLDGFEFGRKIRQNPQTQHVPIIYLSAFLPRKKKMKKKGYEEYFHKPFSPLQLLSKVYEILTSSRIEFELNKLKR